jgi:hypothetical protein
MLNEIKWKVRYQASLTIINEIPWQLKYHNSEHYPSPCFLFKIQLNSIVISVPHRKCFTFPLRVQKVNAIYRFVTMVYLYNYYNSERYKLFYLLLKTQLKSIGLSVPHRKHITFPLQAQHVNAIIGLCRWYNIIAIKFWTYPSPVFYFWVLIKRELW